MAKRILLSPTTRGSIFDIPSDMASRERCYVLATDDLDLFNSRRGAENRLGLAIHIACFAIRAKVGATIIKSRWKLFTGFQGRCMCRPQRWIIMGTVRAPVIGNITTGLVARYAALDKCC